MNLAGDHYRRKEGLYFLSNKFWEYEADSLVGDVSVGASPGIRHGTANRFRLGLGYERSQFDYPVALLARVDPRDAEDRKLVYPYVSYQRVRDDFDKRLNLDRVYRTEDVALGSVLGAQLGWSADRFGGEGDKLLARASYQDSLWLASNQLLTYELSFSGYYNLDRDRSEDFLGQAKLTYRYRHAEAFGLLLRAATAVAHNPPLDKQLVLGGDTGLRGYPTRYQIGDSWFLVTVEERYYSDIYPLRMFRLGAAVFADVGRAWFRQDAPGWVPPDRSAGYFDTLANVGVGLRLESTRTRRDRLLHVDVSLPVRDGPDTRNLEFTVTVKQSL
jgi:outer membrane protein assembly factor BamA